VKRLSTHSSGDSQKPAHQTRRACCFCKDSRPEAQLLVWERMRP
jgi:hypothetical protein